jgi:hypothetical protein
LSAVTTRPVACSTLAALAVTAVATPFAAVWEAVPLALLAFSELVTLAWIR